MTEPHTTREGQESKQANLFALRLAVVLGFAFLMLAFAPRAAHALDLEPVTDTVSDTVEPITETVTDTVEPVTETVTDTVEPVTETVTDTVEPITKTVTATVDQIAAPVTKTVTDVLDSSTAPVQDPPNASDDPAPGEQPPSVVSTPPGSASHDASHDGRVVHGVADRSEEIVAEVGINPPSTSTASASRSSEPSAPTPRSGAPFPGLPPVAGAASGQLLGGGSAGLSLAAVLAAAFALAHGWSRWFRLVQPSRVPAPFVSLAERPG